MSHTRSLPNEVTNLILEDINQNAPRKSSYLQGKTIPKTSLQLTPPPFDEKKDSPDSNYNYEYKVKELELKKGAIALVFTGGFDPPHPYHLKPTMKRILEVYESKKDTEWKDKEIYVFFLPANRIYLSSKGHSYDQARPLFPEHLRIHILQHLIQQSIDDTPDFPQAIHPYVDISECSANKFWDFPDTLESFRKTKKFEKVYHVVSNENEKENKPSNPETTIVVPMETGYDNSHKEKKATKQDKFSSTKLMQGELTPQQITSSPTIRGYLAFLIPLVEFFNRKTPFINPKTHTTFVKAIEKYKPLLAPIPTSGEPLTSSPVAESKEHKEEHIEEARNSYSYCNLLQLLIGVAATGGGIALLVYLPHLTLLGGAVLFLGIGLSVHSFYKSSCNPLRTRGHIDFENKSSVPAP